MEFLPRAQPKSIGRARAFHKAQTTDTHTLLQKLQSHLQMICCELYEHHLEIRHIEILLIDSAWHTTRASYTLPDYSADRQLLFRHVTDLFWQIYEPQTLYRKTGIHCLDLRSKSCKQLSLFSRENTSSHRSDHLEKVLHDVEEKYGKGKLVVGGNREKFLPFKRSVFQ